MQQTTLSKVPKGRIATGITVIVTMAGLLLAAPARVQPLTDLPGGPTLAKGKVIVNDGGPNPLQITVIVVGTTPSTSFDLQFEGFEGGSFFHYRICTFTTDATGSGGCHFDNSVGGAVALVGNAIPLGAGGTISPGTYDLTIITVCPAAVPPASGPDLFLTVWPSATEGPVLVP
jgi:hypothetical protein